jgi:hypothetical protein
MNMFQDLEDLANACITDDAPYGFTLSPRAFSQATVPVPGMSATDFAKYQGTPGGTLVSNTDAGTVAIYRALSEIPNTRRLVAPNFGPTVMYLGFDATRADGSKVLRDYYSPNGRFDRPAMFASIVDAVEALSWPPAQKGARLWYPGDTAESFAAYLAGFHTDTRDLVKDPA